MDREYYNTITDKISLYKKEESLFLEKISQLEKEESIFQEKISRLKKDLQELNDQKNH